MSAPPPYAVTRARSGVGGEVKWDASRNAWQRSASPATELVTIALLCQRGGCPTDPDLGVDWASVNKLRTDAPATARAAILAGLKRYVDAGQIRDVKADVRVFPARGVLEFDVSFIDVQLGAQSRQRVRGEV